MTFLGNIVFLLYYTVLQDNTHDSWIWLLDPIKDFSVNDIYLLFTSSYHNSERVTTTTIWLKHVPLKVTLFA